MMENGEWLPLSSNSNRSINCCCRKINGAAATPKINYRQCAAVLQYKAEREPTINATADRYKGEREPNMTFSNINTSSL